MPRLDLKNEMKTIGAPQRVLCLRLNLFLCPLMLHLESVGGRTGGLPSSLTHSLREASSVFIGCFNDSAVISAVTLFLGVDRWLIGI